MTNSNSLKIGVSHTPIIGLSHTPTTGVSHTDSEATGAYILTNRERDGYKPFSKKFLMSSSHNMSVVKNKKRGDGQANP